MVVLPCPTHLSGTARTEQDTLPAPQEKQEADFLLRATAPQMCAASLTASRVPGVFTTRKHKRASEPEGKRSTLKTESTEGCLG